MIRSMQAITLPCVLMRAGTSRGPFFLRDWLPADETERNATLIGVRELGPDEQVEEIARMLAGETVTDAARSNAREMLAGA